MSYPSSKVEVFVSSKYVCMPSKPASEKVKAVEIIPIALIWGSYKKCLIFLLDTRTVPMLIAIKRQPKKAWTKKFQKCL